MLNTILTLANYGGLNQAGVVIAASLLMGDTPEGIYVFVFSVNFTCSTELFGFT
jgi:hypothetical protein